MAFLIKMKRHRALILFLISNLAYGCASNTSLLGTDQLTIEKVPSEQTDIEGVYVRKADNGISIIGTAKFAQSRLGPPPGYLEVTILAPDGKVLYKAHSNYYRYGKPTKASDTFYFSLTIPLKPPKGSIVRLVHNTPT